ncbi:right-handed parallel beta-helix repeat-containing protein [Microbulbifer sp. TRSA001]|uniref:right-handed parallel beta-helix repeat-containing protein n=1 Tax=Microbulbifer sp. TRSA001 TaxID=3243381 RepID=UPI00403A3690
MLHPINYPKTLYATLILLGISLSSNISAIECGDIITEPATLTEDLTCSIDDPNSAALTIQGPGGSLYMAGFTLTCSGLDQSNGIALTGSSGELSTGTINGCNDAIVLSDGGFHTVYGINIFFPLDDAIVVSSNSNAVIGNYTVGDGSDSDDGIDINGNYNYISQNSIESSGDEGMEIFGVSNTIIENTITGSDSDGVELYGNYNIFVSNTILNNDSTGIVIGGSSCTVSNNTVTGNGSSGILLQSLASNNGLSQNTSSNNGAYGIYVAGIDVIGNSIVFNTTTGNGIFDLFDLFEAEDCSINNNLWSGNIAGSTYPNCLD